MKVLDKHPRRTMDTKEVAEYLNYNDLTGVIALAQGHIEGRIRKI